MATEIVVAVKLFVVIQVREKDAIVCLAGKKFATECNQVVNL